MKRNLSDLGRAAVLGLALALANPVAAQWSGGGSVDFFSGIAASTIQTSAIYNSLPAPGGETGKASAQAQAPAREPGAPVNLSSLTIDWSATVSRNTRSKLVKALAESNPALQGEAETLFSDATWKAFSRLLRAQGYSSDNLADVMTAYYVITWEVVQGRAVQEVPGYEMGMLQTRERLATALASHPDITKLDAAQKQELAETLGYLAALAGAANNQLRQSGDDAALGQLRRSVHEGVLMQGIDLKKLKLSANGFTPA